MQLFALQLVQFGTDEKGTIHCSQHKHEFKNELDEIAPKRNPIVEHFWKRVG